MVMIMSKIFQDNTTESTKEDVASLKENIARLSYALQGSKSGIWDWNLKTNAIYFDENYYKLAGYTPNEFAHKYESWRKRVHPDDIKATESSIKAYLAGKTKEYSSEFRFKTKTNEWMWIRGQGKIFEHDPQGKPVRFTGTHHNITEQKRAEQALIESHETLEEKVLERTSQLKEMNSALKVLLKKRDSDKNDIEEKIFANFKLRVFPTIDRLKKKFPRKPEYAQIELLESELNDIVSSFSKKLTSPMKGFTPMETKIASMVKLGKSNKEISKILSRSVYTIANHRENMRKKLGLQNTKTNLQSYLLNL